MYLIYDKGGISNQQRKDSSPQLKKLDAFFYHVQNLILIV